MPLKEKLKNTEFLFCALLDIISFRCHFEESCDVLKQENTPDEKWLLVAGRDNTLTYDTGKQYRVHYIGHVGLWLVMNTGQEINLSGSASL